MTADGVHLVVGAGVSGLAAAVVLARRGARVRVVDRARREGGLAGSVTFRGVPCDLGSHRLHREALAIPLFEEIARGVGLRERPRRGVLLLGGRRVPYPPTPWGMVRGLGPGASLGMALGYARARGWAHAPRGEDVGFARFVTARVGRAAFEAFYRPYVEKVWGLDAEDISQTVAKKRVSTVDPWALVRGRREEATYLYPEKGFGAIVQWLSDELARLGVAVERADGWDAAGAERVLFSGRLRDLVETSLEHRGVYLVYVALDGAAGDAETYYAPEARYWFGRVGDVGNYAPGRVPRGEAVLCVEVPEGRWGTGRDFSRGPLWDELFWQLRACGIVPRGRRVLETAQVFAPDVYPVYRRGWPAEWRHAMAEAAARHPRVLPFGRQGLFLHCNTDHCVMIAGDAAGHALGDRDARSWAAQAERYLALRVRD